MDGWQVPNLLLVFMAGVLCVPYSSQNLQDEIWGVELGTSGSAAFKPLMRMICLTTPAQETKHVVRR